MRHVADVGEAARRRVEHRRHGEGWRLRTRGDRNRSAGHEHAPVHEAGGREPPRRRDTADRTREAGRRIEDLRGRRAEGGIASLVRKRRAVAAGDQDQTIGERHEDRPGRPLCDRPAGRRQPTSRRVVSLHLAVSEGQDATVAEARDRGRVPQHAVDPGQHGLEGARIGELAVVGETEWFRYAVAAADDEDGRGREEQQQQGEQQGRARRETAKRARPRRQRRVHRQPRAGEGPARPLRRARGLPEDVVEVVGPARRGDLVDRGGDALLERVEPVDGRHAVVPPCGLGTGGTSVVSDRRRPCIARWSRDFAAGREIPRVDAASGSG